jgi:integrase/recombinase XerC
MSKQLQAMVKGNLIPLIRPNPLAVKGYDTLMSDWLGRFSSRHTVRVYRSAIAEFFEVITGEKCFEESLLVSTENLTQFLLLDQKQAYELVSNYEVWLLKKELAPATINRKLASIKSLVNYASEAGKCFYTLSNIKTQTVTTYRDTTGISSETFKTMLATVNRNTIKGKRDYAILLLLWGNALRRSEVQKCQLKHFEPTEKRLWILGKGKKGQLQQISLGKETIKAIQEWLAVRGKCDENEPLFCAVHKGYWGHQLNTDSIYKLVKKYAKLAGIKKVLSPHRLRHSAITAALEATNGDVRSVQKLSRHSSLNTLMIYDDNRRNEQGRVTDLLETLLESNT